jgi:glucose/arabinose dehydrogenase
MDHRRIFVVLSGYRSMHRTERIIGIPTSFTATILVLSLIFPIHTLASAQASTVSLTINSQYTNGQPLTGMYTTLSQNGQTIGTGFTPVTFSLSSNQQYVVAVSNYGQIVFDHWLDNGSTNPSRTVSITQNTVLTAVYKSTSTVSLTVNSQDTTGKSVTGMYTTLSQNGQTLATGFTPVTFSLTSGQQYLVTVSDYGQIFFDHWADNGSTNPSKTISITQNTVLTAVYRVQSTPVSLTVTTQDTTGKALTGMWTVLSQGGTTVATGFTPVTFTLNSAAQYSVGMGDYRTYFFDHWQDTGSLSNTRSLSITTNSQLVAVYRICSPTSGTGSISLTPSTNVNVGAIVRVTGSNFSPNCVATLAYDGSTLINEPAPNPSRIRTDSAGNFVATFPISESIAGTHTISANDVGGKTGTQGIVVVPSATLSPPSGHVSPAALTVRVQGYGFAAGSTITIRYDGNTIATNPATLTSDSTGSFIGASFVVPSSSPAGAHSVQISDANGHSVTTTFTVVSSTTPVFSARNIVTGLTPLTEMAFIPDNGPGKDGSGSFMVAQKDGSIIVVKNNGAGVFTTQPIHFADVPVTQIPEDGGLLGLAIDPNWINTKFVYVYRTIQPPAPAPMEGQVLRYVAIVDSSGNIVANPNSMQIIIGGIPATSLGHNGGHLKIDSAGDLYITTGDNYQYYISQDLTSLAGKMLRITPFAAPNSTGNLYSIPSTNPFAGSTVANIRKEIYSYGMRNVFSFDIDPLNHSIFMNHIGDNTAEQINDSTTSPINFGWPFYEGPVVGNPDNLANYKNPIYWYTHSGNEPASGLIGTTGGAFYHSGGASMHYPTQLEGSYFFGDFGVGFIKAILPASTNPPQTDPATGALKAQTQTILTGLNLAPIDMQVWNGQVFYTDLFGDVAVIQYGT